MEISVWFLSKLFSLCGLQEIFIFITDQDQDMEWMKIITVAGEEFTTSKSMKDLEIPFDGVSKMEYPSP